MVKLHYFKNQRYSKLKAQCERDERLFVDPEFPPETKSLYFSRATPPEPVEWKRPKVSLKEKMVSFLQRFLRNELSLDVQQLYRYQSFILQTIHW